MLSQLLLKAVEKSRDKAAIVYENRRITYGELNSLAARFSKGLHSINVRAGDGIAVILPNCPEWIVALFAAARVKAVMLPLNPMLNAEEIAKYINDVCPKVIITDSYRASMCRNIISESGRETSLILVSGNEQGQAEPDSKLFYKFDELLVADHEADAETDAEPYEGKMLYLFTSGSTGKFKRVCRTQKNLYYEGVNFCETLNLKPSDNIICVIPLFHSYGLGNCLLAAVSAGSSLVISDPRTEDGKSLPFAGCIGQFFETVKKENIKIFPGVPYQFDILADIPNPEPMTSHLSYCLSSGNFLSEDVFNRFLKRFGIPIRSLYGSTETGSVSMNLEPADDMKYDAQRPLCNISIKILNDNGDPASEGEISNICVKSPVIPPGVYDNLPELPGELFIKDYYRTGDIGKTDSDGRLFITGRKKTFIDTGGYKVDPEEIESAIKTHPKVKDAVVVGIKTPDGNEMIKAVIVPKEFLEKREIADYCKTRMAAFKIPKFIEFREELPRSPLGKLLKKELLHEGSEVRGERSEVSSHPSPLTPHLSVIKKHLTEIAADILMVGREDIDEDTSISEYGFDSVTLTALVSRIMTVYDIEVLPSVFFGQPSLGAFAEYLCETFGEKMMGGAGSEVRGERLSNPAAVELRGQRSSVYSHLSPRTPNLSPIAIIGMAGMMPQSPDLETFWEHLKNGHDLITEIPKERWDWEAYYGDPEKENKTRILWGGFMKQVDRFDARFFSMSPREAEMTDPQHRIFLETAWRCIEDAGYNVSDLSGTKTGVFVGISSNDYADLLKASASPDAHQSTGIYHSILPNRISYLLNLLGPSEAVDTACSSALVALHRAVTSIQNRECLQAIAGSVNVLLNPQVYIVFDKAGMLSRSGRCRTFDKRADGYARGEGAGALLLKPLDKAEKDGDHIYGIIRGTAVNHGGRAAFLTAPNPNAQAELLIEAYEKSDTDPATVTFIETHGTGTELGDPVEINGLKKAFRILHERSGRAVPPTGYCGLGAVKTNIGHLEAASGIAGMMKVLLCMKHKLLPKTVHFQDINPQIQLESSPFYIVSRQQAWKPLKDESGNTIPLRAGVSSFGIGGTNAHVVIEEYREPVCEETEFFEKNSVSEIMTPQIIPLSARNEERLKVYATNLADFIEKRSAASPNPEPQTSSPSLADIAYTLQIGRQAMEERVALVVSDIGTLVERLRQFSRGKNDIENFYSGNAKKEGKNAKQLISGAFGEQFVRTVIENNDADRLAILWISGAINDWKLLYPELGHRRRISLPTYPFAQERYWIPEEAGNPPCPPLEKWESNPECRNERSEILAKDYISTQGMGTRNELKTRFTQSAGTRTGGQIKETRDISAAAADYLIETIASVLKLDLQHLQPDDDFEEYGLDSILIAQLNSRLQEQFGKLPATLFFKYKNTESLARYFVENHYDKIKQLVNIEKPSRERERVEKAKEETRSLTLPARNREIEEPKTSHFSLLTSHSSLPIAVIGVSGKYPMAENTDEYWENLKAGRNCVTEIPKARWDYKKYPGMYCKWGGFISDIDKFDPLFFNISPDMARFMDPQERLFFQAVWSCLEDAGYTRSRLEDPNAGDRRGNVGVFAGVSFNEYQLYAAAEWAKGNFIPANSQICWVANRISHFFNFRGPSLSVDTACSSSLYAIHLACESLLKGECGMAIAGGVNLSVHPNKYLTLCGIRMLSSQGCCKAFGEGGDGMVSGEAVGAVLLKPLHAAIKDRDTIYAVIKGTAANHDGKTRGYTVPNPVAQAEVIKAALDKSGIDPRTVSYVEAHGTGTSLGDPIEITGLTDAFASYTGDKQYCAIGSVKSNIGHSEAAAGIAQLTKVILQMKHQTLVPTLLHSERLNPNIAFETTPFYVQLKTEEWKRPVITKERQTVTFPRRAGISSFSATGVNVHVVVEEYEEGERSEVRGQGSSPQFSILNSQFQRWCVQVLFSVFQDMGVFLHGGESWRKEELKATIKLVSRYEPLFEAMLGILAESGFITISGEMIGVRGQGSEVRGMKHTLTPNPEPRTSLLKTCAENCPAVLRGEIPATSVIFPNASMELVEGVYFQDDMLNHQLAESVKACVRMMRGELKHGEKIKILEIGAGTGGATASILDALNEYQRDISYNYTDISRGFLIFGKEKFGNKYDFVEFRLLDIEKEVEEQGYELNSYHIVIAVNVLHATRRMSHTVRHIKNLLSRQGVLFLRELTGLTPFLTMTFGLLDGWWLFEDKENRIQGSPLLTPEKWKEILEKQGFGAVFSIAHDSEPEHLIIAESSAVSVSEQHLVPVFLAEISPDAAANENEITLIPLSTKSEKNLLLYAQQLKTFLEKKCRQGNAPSLADIAFTLQVGREAMPFRLAFAVKTTDELIAKIDRLLSMSATEELFGDRAEILPGVFAGKVPLQKKEKGMDRSYLFDIVKKGMINRLAELWVHGADADWNLLIPGDAAARRVPLPTYPFLKERYWIGSDSAESPVIASETVLPPKPLLNDSAVSPEKEQMSQVVNRIRNIASKILGFSPSELPPAEMGFFDMGMESVQILEFGAQVSENFKVELYPTALFDYPTIADISRYIMEQVAGGREQVSPATCNLQPATLYYRSEWEASEAAGMRKARTESLITYHSSLLTFLVFASDNNVSEALKERLQSQAGAHVSLILVKPGKSWQNIGDNTYQIRPERPEDYQRLLQELIIREQIPSGIVHLWSEERFHEIGARLETGLEMSIYSVFYLTQALMAQKIRHRIRLLYVYQEDKDKPCPLYAAVSGFARTVRLENPNFAWKTIAMGGQGSGVRGQGNISSYLSPLTSDLLTDSDDEIAVLYYAGKRWVSRLRQFDPEIAPDKKLLLKAGGVYLITGGAGGIGMIFASYLAEKAEKAKIILTGRSELSHEKKAEIERLASFGAEAVYIRTDISDKKAVNRLISEIRSRYGEINGVIHAAGLLRDNFVIKKTAEEFEAVLGPKVYGTLYLDEALKDEELDFFVMFSSLTASVGNPGQSDYAYSNSFMDSFAASREQLCRQNQRKGKTVSIIWPYWRQGGMRIDENTEKLMTEKRGLIPIEKEDGFRTFEIALLSDTLQVGILKGDVRKAAEVLGVRPLSPEERGRIVTSHPKPLTPNPKPIALIGMACRFPGDCSSPEKFWRLLQEGRHCVTAIPPERWNADDFYDPDPNVSGKSYVREAAFLQEDVGNFDARFFGMSPREAADTDPQQRLLLETAYQALERAGQSHKGLRGSQTGVFVGIIGSEYSKIQKQGPYKATGCVSSVASGRIAHVLGLQGPALSIDTACSSSLVSVHLACESLRRRECDMALAGGVSLMLSPDTFADLCALKALSKDGKCKAFDADGDGYGRGEGCGMVVLKRLEDARKDGDPILAVIRGSAVNHDGSASGLTVPNGAAQEKLLRKALENAGVTPDEISYIETHGTGTSLGDPIEMRAISQVFGNGHSRNAHPLIVGSVKANIGHLEAAAGIAGLIKTVLCLNHREIPPQLHIKKINPKMAHETIPALIPQSRINWNTNGKARIAGVSSFGFSGTNAHVIVSEERFEVRGSGSEETPLTADPAPRTPHLLTLSAMDENALKTLASDYKFFLDEHSEIAITDVCYTANAARAHFACRAAFIAEDAKEMSAALQKFRFAHFCTPEENGISDAVGVSPRAYPAEKILDLPRTDSPEQWKTLLETLAEQYCRGDEIDWEGFYAPLTARRKVILPTYPFQRRRYWGEGERSEVRGQGSEASPNLEPRTSNPSSLDYSLNTDCLPEIKDNLGVLHVGYYQEMLCKAVKTLYHTAAYTLKEMEYLIALYAPDNVSKILHLNLIPAEESAQNGEVEFRFYSSDAATSDAKQKAGLLNARGRLTLNEHCMLPIMSLPEIADIQKRCQKQMSGFSFYQKMKEERGMDLGQSVRQIEHIWCREGEALARFRYASQEEKRETFSLGIHPGLWDACAQVYFSAFSKEIPPNVSYMMVRWKDFVADSQQMPEEPLWCHVELWENPGKDGLIRGKFHVFDRQGRFVAAAAECEMKPIREDMFRLMADMDKTGLEKHDRRKAGLKPALQDGDPQAVLQQYLHQKIAAILQMPLSELDIKEPLSNLGMDSLVALELRTAAEKDMGIEIPLEELIQGTSIVNLTETILLKQLHHEECSAETHKRLLETQSLASLHPSEKAGDISAEKTERDLWFAHRKVNPESKLRLFCLPYGAGGASLFRSWQEKLPDDVEVCPIQLTGRENRIKSKPVENIAELTDMLELVLKPELDRPYAFYGHSMGALIAFQLACRLQSCAVRPAHLFVGGFASPAMPNPYLARIIASFRDMGFQGIPNPREVSRLSEKEIEALREKIREMRRDISATGNISQFSILNSQFFADMKIVESYVHQEGELLGLPVTAFHGKDDSCVSLNETEAWKSLTAAAFNLHILQGDHFFLHEKQSQEKMLTIIAEELTPLLKFRN